MIQLLNMHSNYHNILTLKPGNTKENNINSHAQDTIAL